MSILSEKHYLIIIDALEYIKGVKRDYEYEGIKAEIRDIDETLEEIIKIRRKDI